MRLAPKLLLLLILTTALIATIPKAADGARSRPHASRIRTAPRASPEYIAWARSWHRADLRWTRLDNRLRACFGMGHLVPVPRAPRVSDANAWRSAANAWRSVAIGRSQSARTLWNRLVSPDRPYHASSWWPLAESVGWPASAKSMWFVVVTRESHGQPGAVNKHSGASGLMQIFPGGRRYLDPTFNLRAGLAKFRASGWAPWAATAW